MPLSTIGIILYLAFFGGAIGVLGKFAFPVFTPDALILIRLIISVACFMLVLWHQKKLYAALQLLCNNFLLFLALAASGIGGGMILGFIGLTHTTAANYGLLFNTSAVFIVFFSVIIFQETITRRDIALFCIASLGAILIVTNGNFAFSLFTMRWRGDLFVLLAAIGWALYSVLGPLFARRHPDVNSITIVFNTFLVGILFLFPYVVGRGGITLAHLNFSSLATTFALGVFSTAILFYFWLEFVRTSGGLRGSLVTLGENISGVALPILFLGERPSIATFIGGALIVGAIIAKKS